MAVHYRHIRQHLPVIAGLGRVALAAATQKPSRGAPMEVPGPILTERLPARDADLVRDYLRWAGGDPSAYRGRVPAHLFPQWGFPLQGRTLEGITYPIAKVLNGGCRLEIHGDIPIGAPLEVAAQLARVDDDGRRAVLHQTITTSVDGRPRCTAHIQAFVPLAGKDKGERPARKRRSPALVPIGAREVGWWRLGPKSGLEFACLTGDFNPVHWVAAYGRMAGFRGTILHGFGTLARTVESLNRVLWAGDTRRLSSIDVRFTRPLRLPARVGCYVEDNSVFVGDAPGAPAYLTGTFSTGDAP